MFTTLDLLPTFCDAAGVPCPDDVDGTSLVPLLRRQESGRDIVFTVFHETSAKRRFEMRCAQTPRYGYIWNAWSDGATAYKAENMAGLTWSAMATAAAEDAELGERVEFYEYRTPEELYDLESDPSALMNLVGSPEHAERLVNMRSVMREWMQRTQDPLAGAYDRFVGAQSEARSPENA